MPTTAITSLGEVTEKAKRRASPPSTSAEIVKEADAIELCGPRGGSVRAQGWSS